MSEPSIGEATYGDRYLDRIHEELKAHSKECRERIEQLESGAEWMKLQYGKVRQVLADALPDMDGPEYTFDALPHQTFTIQWCKNEPNHDRKLWIRDDTIDVLGGHRRRFENLSLKSQALVVLQLVPYLIFVLDDLRTRST